MDDNYLCNISSDESDEAPATELSYYKDESARPVSQSSFSATAGEANAVDLSPASSPEHMMVQPRKYDAENTASYLRSPSPQAISSDEDHHSNKKDNVNISYMDDKSTRLGMSHSSPRSKSNLGTTRPSPSVRRIDLATAEASKIESLSSDESEGNDISAAAKPAKNASLWLDEHKRWQRLTAADFDDVGAPSEDENEPLDERIQTVGETSFWSQSIIPTKYYVRNGTGGQRGTPALQALQSHFEERVLLRVRKSRDAQPRSDPPPLPKFHSCSGCTKIDGASSSSSSSSFSSSSSSEDDKEEKEEGEASSSDSSRTSTPRSSSASSFSSGIRECEALLDDDRRKKPAQKRLKPVNGAKARYRPSKQTLAAKAEIDRKQNHQSGLHRELSFNEPGQLNDGPLCRCSWASKRTGVRHNKYVGETAIPKCDLAQSNIECLHHYVLQVTPNPNELTRGATSICVDSSLTYVFDGFSVFFHRPLPDAIPQTPLNNWNSDFKARFQRENCPESFTVRDLELFHEFLFEDVMEMYDLNRLPNVADSENSCPYFHCLPRFARLLNDGGKEILPMSAVLQHFAGRFLPFAADDKAAAAMSADANRLMDVTQSRKGGLFLNPEKKPMCIRVDLIDKPDLAAGHDNFPIFTHFGVRPSAYAYNGRPEYQRALKHFIKLRHLLSLKPRPNADDRQALRHAEAKLKRLRADCKQKRDVQARVSSRGFFDTGLYPDVVQHALMLVSMCAHVRFHWSLRVYEESRLGYVFRNKILLELSLTHPSYRFNYGTNPDHVKNTINNCGLLPSRQRAGGCATPPTAASGEEKTSGRKRGIAALMEIMSRQGSAARTDNSDSSVHHNERLEFLGDAVVEFITTVHLFFMFPDLEEGGLAMYRSALVQNKHLATLAKKLGLQEFMLYAHGPDLCHEAELRHAMANAFEAMMAAVFLDSNVNECDRIFAVTLHKDEPELAKRWQNLPEHQLKREHPFGDRHLIDAVPCLKRLTEFEDKIGLRFKHIRLLAKAFTRRNIGFNYLTLGHNQRLEFLGDTVLQLITTEYLYRHFPNHQEGHLSLLRTCLVSNKTQSVICDDLAIPGYLIIPKTMRRGGSNIQLRVKDKADLVESLLGALYVDRGLQYCKVFCRVCFFPRLKYFILTQRWNDPKSQLQQCCLTLRQAGSGTGGAGADPDIPEYKTIGAEGPTNTRVYRVAVYFRGQRLAEGAGGSIQLAEMQAAENALIEKAHLFSAFDFSNTYLGVKLAPSADDNKTPKTPNHKRPAASTIIRPETKRQRFESQQRSNMKFNQSTLTRTPSQPSIRGRGFSEAGGIRSQPSLFRSQLGYNATVATPPRFSPRDGRPPLPQSWRGNLQRGNFAARPRFNNNNKNNNNYMNNDELPIRFF